MVFYLFMYTIQILVLTIQYTYILQSQIRIKSSISNFHVSQPI